MTALFCLAGAALLVGAVFWHESPEQRRKRCLAVPFPPEWEEILKRNVGLYPRLPQRLKDELKDRVRIFLEEKNFEGCGGLEITDEIRVTVAGSACLLLLNRVTNYFRGLSTILMYPRGYRDGEEGRLGESWGNGTVVLSWCDVTRSSLDVKDGHNLVLHEFAHQLDQQDGVADGVPPLQNASRYATWASMLESEYSRLVRMAEKGKRDVLDAYGATNEAEFFAVATETFFEKPRQLHKKHPELYAQLKEFYQLDPEAWLSGSRSPSD